MSDPVGSTGSGLGPDAEPVVGVPGSARIGSAALARALSVRGLDAIGRALRHDVAVVPVVTDAEGRVVNRVFPVAGADRSECAVFSSTAALGMFLEDDDSRRFVLASGDDLRAFLLARHEALTSVVFDPAGPTAVEASVDDVIAVLAPQPGDDDVAWAIAGGEPGDGGVDAGRLSVGGPDGGDVDAGGPGAGASDPGASDPGARAGGGGDAPTSVSAASSSVTGLTLELHHDWFEVGLADAGARDAQIDELAERRLPREDGDALPREAFERWMYVTCRRATAHGRFLALLLRRTRRYPVAFGLTMYWFELGEASAAGHLQRVTDRLRATLGAGDDLALATAPAGRFVRHSWALRPAGRPPLTLIDYWFAFPDGRGLCLLAFSTPQARLRGPLQDAADQVALSASWVRPCRPHSPRARSPHPRA